MFRTGLRGLVVWLLSIPAAAAMTGLSTLAAERKPNVVFFLVDDLGQRDVGCYGSTFYETPNIDRLGQEGARFTSAYAACPVCSPTRASILTGLYPQRTGITDYIGAARTPELWNRNTKLLPAPYEDRLAHAHVTLAEILKNAGYATFFAGKWHLGPEGWWPEDQGFVVNQGGTDRGGPYGGSKYFSPYGNPRLKDGPPGEHLPDRLATETTKFIEQNKDRQFVAYLSFYSVHTPLMSREDLQRKYEAKRERLGLVPKLGQEGPRNVRLVQEHAVYAGMVEAMDLAVGKVLAKLDELQLRDNTIVVFTSDNGGLSTSEGSPTSNSPLRAGKGWLYEGGIRVPLVIRWPNVTKPGSIVDDPVTSTDFFPTLVEAAGATMAEDHPKDGVSLVSLLRSGDSLPMRTIFWHYPHYGNQGGAPGSAVRSGDWKLIHWFEDDRFELYNLADDLSEQRDLSAERPDKVAELKAVMTRLHADTGSVNPTINRRYDPTKPSGRAANQAKAKSKKRSR